MDQNSRRRSLLTANQITTIFSRMEVRNYQGSRIRVVKFNEQSEFLSRTKNINHFVRETGGGISVVFGFRGNVIPLMKFSTHINSSGQVVTQVKRSGSAATLDRAFSAQMGGHRGIYERIGPSRFPVEELYGPATPQMMYSNEAVTDEIEQKVADTYEKRIDHEILRVLNGWGR